MKPHLEDLDPRPYRLPEGWSERLSTPALVVFAERVRANVARVLELCGGPDRWRPHVKTTKTPEIWSELVRAGVRHFKCATTREAAALCACARANDAEGVDVLLAYPSRGPAIERLAAIAREFPETRVSMLCEDSEQAPLLPRELGVFVDIDPGMHRTGVPQEDVDTILRVARAAGERLRGLHYYEGHLRQADFGERERAIHAGLDLLLAIEEQCVADGLAIGELITSGTPAFLSALSHPRMLERAGRPHRVSPGTVVLHDGNSELDTPRLGLRPAALVATRVVSHPGAGRFTCDAGTKSVAAEAGHPCAWLVGAPECVAGAPSEEHLPFEAPADRVPPRGELRFLVPRHVCPTVNLAGRALLVDGDEARIVEVVAAGHEL